MDQRKMLGEIFIEQKLLSPTTVSRVVEISKSLNKRFGSVLEEMGLITGEELAFALSQQYNCKMISNFAKGVFTPDLLAIVPPEVALHNLLFPLKREGNKLALAMYDPTNTRVVNNIATNNNLTILPFVATSREINLAICRNYFGREVVEPLKRSVLVVDDNKVVLEMMKNVLSKEYLVFTAEDGIEAYKEVLSKKPHVLLIDKEMPKLDGYALLSSLKNMPETRTIPAILITGTLGVDEELTAFDKGFFDIIHKPLQPPVVLARVKRAFDFMDKKLYMFMA